MSEIDPRAIVSSSARIGSGARVGAFAVVGDEVELGGDCVLEPHAVVRGPARIGRKNIFDSFCSVGGDPQDLKFSGERTELVVGDANRFREFSTVSRGTTQGGGVTRIGSNNLFMAYSHIAHDCNVGSHAVFANGATLGLVSPRGGGITPIAATLRKDAVSAKSLGFITSTDLSKIYSLDLLNTLLGQRHEAAITP